MIKILYQNSANNYISGWRHAYSIICIYDKSECIMSFELPKLCYHPGCRLMRLGYHMCFHTYDEKKKNDKSECIMKLHDQIKAA